MRRSTAFALLAIVLTSTFVRLGPLLRSLYWGADIGEYFALLQALVARGVMPTRYLGWGITYPVFPGLFLVLTTLAFNLLGDGLRDALDVRAER